MRYSLFLLFSLFIFNNSFAQKSYCVPSTVLADSIQLTGLYATSYKYEPNNNVQTYNYNHINSNNLFLQKGKLQQYLVQYKRGYSSSFLASIAVWVDLNKDCDFDDSDEVIFQQKEISFIDNYINIDLYIPHYVDTLSTRMRIVISSLSLDPAVNDPCSPPGVFQINDFDVRMVDSLLSGTKLEIKPTVFSACKNDKYIIYIDSNNHLSEISTKVWQTSTDGISWKQSQSDTGEQCKGLFNIDTLFVRLINKGNYFSDTSNMITLIQVSDSLCNLYNCTTPYFWDYSNNSAEYRQNFWTYYYYPKTNNTSAFTTTHISTLHSGYTDFEYLNDGTPFGYASRFYGDNNYMFTYTKDTLDLPLGNNLTLLFDVKTSRPYLSTYYPLLYMYIYFDYDKDGVIDANELYKYSYAPKLSNRLFVNLSIPSNISTGNITGRIFIKSSNVNIVGGQCVMSEDFINIVAKVADVPAGCAAALLPKINCLIDENLDSAYLSLQKVYVSGTTKVQWQISIDSAIWDDISQANSTLYLTTTYYNKWIRVRVICGVDTAFSEPILLPSKNIYSPLPYHNNFENSWPNIQSFYAKPDSLWEVSTLNGNSSWRQTGYGNSAGWTPMANILTEGEISQQFTDNKACIHTSAVTNQTTTDLSIGIGKLNIHKELKVEFDYYNATGLDSLQVLYTLDNGNSYTILKQLKSISGYPNHIVLQIANPGVHIMKLVFRCLMKEQNGDDICIDNMRIVEIEKNNTSAFAGTLKTNLTEICTNKKVILYYDSSSFDISSKYYWQIYDNSISAWKTYDTSLNNSIAQVTQDSNYFRVIVQNNYISDTSNQLLVLAKSSPLCICDSFDFSSKTNIAHSIEILDANIAGTFGSPKPNRYSLNGVYDQNPLELQTNEKYYFQALSYKWGNAMGWLDKNLNGGFEDSEVVIGNDIQPLETGINETGTTYLKLDNMDTGMYMMRVRFSDSSHILQSTKGCAALGFAGSTYDIQIHLVDTFRSSLNDSLMNNTYGPISYIHPTDICNPFLLNRLYFLGTASSKLFATRWYANFYASQPLLGSTASILCNRNENYKNGLTVKVTDKQYTVSAASTVYMLGVGNTGPINYPLNSVWKKSGCSNVGYIHPVSYGVVAFWQYPEQEVISGNLYNRWAGKNDASSPGTLFPSGSTFNSTKDINAANFNGYNVPAYHQGNIFVALGIGGLRQVVNYSYRNKTGDDSLFVYYSNDFGVTYDIKRKLNIDSTSTKISDTLDFIDNSNIIVRFRGIDYTGGKSDNISIDQVASTEISGCSGSGHFAGQVYALTTNFCLNDSFIIWIQNDDPKFKYFSWQKSYDSKTWVSIGKTDSLIKDTLNGPAYFRCIVKCHKVVDTSDMIYLTLNCLKTVVSKIPYCQDFESPWINGILKRKEIPDLSWENKSNYIYTPLAVENHVRTPIPYCTQAWDVQNYPLGGYGNASISFRPDSTIPIIKSAAKSGLYLHVDFSDTSDKMLSFDRIVSQKCTNDSFLIILSLDSGKNYDTLYKTVCGSAKWKRIYVPFYKKVSPHAVIGFITYKAQVTNYQSSAIDNVCINMLKPLDSDIVLQKINYINKPYCKGDEVSLEFPTSYIGDSVNYKVYFKLGAAGNWANGTVVSNLYRYKLGADTAWITYSVSNKSGTILLYSKDTIKISSLPKVFCTSCHSTSNSNIQSDIDPQYAYIVKDLSNPEQIKFNEGNTVFLNDKYSLLQNEKIEIARMDSPIYIYDNGLNSISTILSNTIAGVMILMDVNANGYYSKDEILFYDAIRKDGIVNFKVPRINDSIDWTTIQIYFTEKGFSGGTYLYDTICGTAAYKFHYTFIAKVVHDKSCTSSVKPKLYINSILCEYAKPFVPLSYYTTPLSGIYDSVYWQSSFDSSSWNTFRISKQHNDSCYIYQPTYFRILTFCSGSLDTSNTVFSINRKLTPHTLPYVLTGNDIIYNCPNKSISNNNAIFYSADEWSDIKLVTDSAVYKNMYGWPSSKIRTKLISYEVERNELSPKGLFADIHLSLSGSTNKKGSIYICENSPNKNTYPEKYYLSISLDSGQSFTPLDTITDFTKFQHPITHVELLYMPIKIGRIASPHAILRLFCPETYNNYNATTPSYYTYFDSICVYDDSLICDISTVNSGRLMGDAYMCRNESGTIGLNGYTACPYARFTLQQSTNTAQWTDISKGDSIPSWPISIGNQAVYYRAIIDLFGVRDTSQVKYIRLKEYEFCPPCIKELLYQNNSYQYCEYYGASMTNGGFRKNNVAFDFYNSGDQMNQPYNWIRSTNNGDERVHSTVLDVKSGDMLQFAPSIYLNEAMNYNKAFVGIYLDMNRDELFDSSELLLLNNHAYPRNSCNNIGYCGNYNKYCKATWWQPLDITIPEKLKTGPMHFRLIYTANEIQSAPNSQTYITYNYPPPCGSNGLTNSTMLDLLLNIVSPEYDLSLANSMGTPCPGDSSPVHVKLYNVGKYSINPDTLYVRSIVKDITTGSVDTSIIKVQDTILNPYDTLLLTLSNNYYFQKNHAYSIKFVILNSNDSVKTNDSCSIAFDMRPKIKLPFVERFTTGNGGPILFYDSVFFQNNIGVFSSRASVMNFKKTYAETKYLTENDTGCYISFYYKMLDKANVLSAKKSNDTMVVEVLDYCDNASIWNDKVALSGNLNEQRLYMHLMPQGLPYLFKVRVSPNLNDSFEFVFDNFAIAKHQYVILGVDTQSCHPVEIRCSNGFFKYQWNQDSLLNKDSINVKTTCINYVIAEDLYGLLSYDTILVQIDTFKGFTIGADTILCSAGNFIIRAKNIPANASLKWSNGSTGDTLVVSGSGKYWVTVTTPDSCQDFDTVSIIYDKSLDSVKIITLASSQGKSNIGKYTNPDLSCFGDTIKYTTDTLIGLGSGYSNYKKLWVADTAYITTIYNNLPTGSQQFISTLGNAPQLLFIPALADGDSLFKITYIVRNINSGCIKVLYRYLKEEKLPTKFLSNDTGICYYPNILYNINCIGQFYKYKWENGSTLSYFPTNTSGKHKLTVQTNAGCSYTDSVNITIANPIVDIGKDTTSCSNITLLIKPKLNSYVKSYKWSTGDTTSTLLAYKSGIYSLQIKDSFGCVANDTISLIVDTLQLSLPDRIICPGDSVFISAYKLGFVSCSWSNGPNQFNQTINNAGLYIATVTTNKSCVLKDSFYLSIHNTAGNFILGAYSKTYCKNDSIALIADTGLSNIKWSSGLTSDTIYVSKPGIIYLKATDAFGCNVIDSANISMDYVSFSLGPDKYYCKNSAPTINGPAAYKSYLWSTSDTSQDITPKSEGKYWLQVSKASGCKSTDSINLFELSVPVATFSQISINQNTNKFTADSFYIKAQYYWDFGDGNNDTGKIVTHTFNQFNTYITSLFITDSSTCKDSSNMSVQIVNGVQTITLSEVDFDVFPNPFNNYLNLVSPDFTVKGFKVEIFDNLGKLVLNSNILGNNCTLPMPQIASGIYLLKITTANDCYVYKLMKGVQ